MKVYKVCYRNHNGEELLVGYYSTHEKADDKVGQILLEFPYQGKDGWKIGIAEIEIDTDDKDVINNTTDYEKVKALFQEIGIDCEFYDYPIPMIDFHNISPCRKGDKVWMKFDKYEKFKKITVWNKE